MATTISKVSLGGGKPKKTIKNLKVIAKGGNYMIITYVATDMLPASNRHYITLNGVKTEITNNITITDDILYTHEIKGLANATNYTIQISIKGEGREVFSKEISERTEEKLIWGFEIDEANSNSETCVSYIGDNLNFTPAKGGDWGSWKNKFPFNKIRPCGFKRGRKVAYLQEFDFNKYENGTTVNHLETDTMIEFPRLYWKFSRQGTKIRVEIADSKIDEEFICPAHTLGTREISNIYIGAYEGSEQNGELRSVPNKTPQVAKTIGQFRTLAQTHGTGYQQFCYYPMLMLQILYTLMYKNLNSQLALGKGYTNNGTTSAVTGGTSKKGMLYGSQDPAEQVKFLGIEDIFGNVWDFVDGYFRKDNHNYVSTQTSFNDNGDGYADEGESDVVVISANYLEKVIGTSKLGFLPAKNNRSETTFYCDRGWLINNCFITFGGSSQDTSQAGIFSQSVNFEADTTWETTGARLIYLGGGR